MIKERIAIKIDENKEPGEKGAWEIDYKINTDATGETLKKASKLLTVAEATIVGSSIAERSENYDEFCEMYEKLTRTVKSIGEKKYGKENL